MNGELTPMGNSESVESSSGESSPGIQNDSPDNDRESDNEFHHQEIITEAIISSPEGTSAARGGPAKGRDVIVSNVFHLFLIKPI